MNLGGKTALTVVPSPFTHAPTWKIYLMFHWKQTALLSLTKPLPFNDGLAYGFVICQINLLLTVTRDTLQTVDP